MTQITFAVQVTARVLNKKEAYEKFMPSSLQQEIDVKYQDLIRLLGEPTYTFVVNSKTDAEWALETNTGDRVIVYNYKDGKAYLGSKGKKIEKITEWHIGGNNEKVSKAFADALEEQCNTFNR